MRTEYAFDYKGWVDFQSTSLIHDSLDHDFIFWNLLKWGKDKDFPGDFKLKKTEVGRLVDCEDI